jgi:hypothetical protein
MPSRFFSINVRRSATTLRTAIGASRGTENKAMYDSGSV